MDLITISSHHNITAERETRLQKLFPDENTPRAFKFLDKKVMFLFFSLHLNMYDKVEKVITTIG